MAEAGVAKVFMHGRSQAVRLPKEFRLPVGEVRVRRVGDALVLEPLEFDATAWFAELDSAGAAGFLDGWERDQPPTPPPIRGFDEP